MISDEHIQQLQRKNRDEGKRKKILEEMSKGIPTKDLKKYKLEIK